MNSKMPEAYKRGFQDFYGRDFLVTPDVLIPRPETEAIIDEVKVLSGRAYLPGMKTPERKLPDNPMILDVGTGSGCIAATLKLEIPEAEVTGLDISEDALNIARNNTNKLNASVDFVHSDLLKDYHGKEPDVIVANLPYVDEDWDWIDKDALGYEPGLALYTEQNGLALIYQLIGEIKRVWENGKTKWIILEADPSQHDAIIKFAKKNGLEYQKTSGFQLVFCSPSRD